MNEIVNCEPKLYKIILIGDTECGKSSLLDRLCYDVENEEISSSSYKLPNIESTVGVSFDTIELKEPNNVRFHIWDTAGQERFMSLAPMYSRDSRCVIIVFDVNRFSSWEETKIKWIKFLVYNFLVNNDEDINQKPLIILVGNKIDLIEKDKIFDYKQDLLDFYEGQKDVQNLIKDIHFALISVKTGEGVSNLFEYITKELIKRAPTFKIKKTVDVTHKKEFKGCKCVLQ